MARARASRMREATSSFPLGRNPSRALRRNHHGLPFGHDDLRDAPRVERERVLEDAVAEDHAPLGHARDDPHALPLPDRAGHDPGLRPRARERLPDREPEPLRGRCPRGKSRLPTSTWGKRYALRVLRTKSRAACGPSAPSR